MEPNPTDAHATCYLDGMWRRWRLSNQTADQQTRKIRSDRSFLSYSLSPLRHCFVWITSFLVATLLARHGKSIAANWTDTTSRTVC